MKMIRAIVRQERVYEVMKALMDAGYPGMTKFGVFGRGKQRGVKIGDVTYDELPKEMLMLVVPDADVPLAVNLICTTARTRPDGAMGDGRIFVTDVVESYTISTGKRDEDTDDELADAAEVNE